MVLSYVLRFNVLTFYVVTSLYVTLNVTIGLPVGVPRQLSVFNMSLAVRLMLALSILAYLT